MVRVLKCHHFRSQVVIPSSTEPLAMCTAGESTLVVATRNCAVEIFTIQSRSCQKTQSFPTEAPVKEICYNKKEQYLATIEYKTTRQGDFFYVKVYLNWNTNVRSAMKARMAGKIPNQNYNDTGLMVIEVIEIPLAGQVSSIGTCCGTGNLAVAFEDKIQLYFMSEKTIPHTKKTYNDMTLALELQYEFPVAHLSLCEDYLACSSTDTAQVIQMAVKNQESVQNSPVSADDGNAQDYSQTAHSRHWGSSGIAGGNSDSKSPAATEQVKFSKIGMRAASVTPSPSIATDHVLSKFNSSCCNIIDDANFIMWNFKEEMPSKLESTDDVKDQRRKKRHSKRVLPKTILLESLQRVKDEGSTDLEAPLIIVYDDAFSDKEIVLKSVLSNTAGMGEALMYVQLIPACTATDEALCAVANDGNPFLSADQHASRIGLSCFISGTRNAVMYTVAPEVQLLSTYKYTSNVKKVTASLSLLHVVTDFGLETYTSRSQHMSFHTEKNNATTACPSRTLDTCMIGMQPFIGACQITASEEYVILLSVVDSSTPTGHHDSAWSLYALQSSQPAEIYNDMVKFGDRYRADGPDAYCHLLQEGHMILKSSLIGSSVPDSCIDEQFHDSCGLLGEYYTDPNSSDWKLCLPYYLMSGWSLTKIIERALLVKKQLEWKSFGPGLLYFLNNILFDEEKEMTFEEDSSDNILEIYLDCEPHKLSFMILFSRLKFRPESACNLLKQWMNQKNKQVEQTRSLDLIARAVVGLQLCEPDSAQAALAVISKVGETMCLDSMPCTRQTILAVISKTDLVALCIEHYELLYDATELSPLSQVMRQHCSQVFIDILVALHDQQVLLMDQAIRLLQGQTSDEEIHKNTHVRGYLETLLNDKKRKFIFSEASTLLCDIYVRRLREWRPPTFRHLGNSKQFQLPKGNGHFGSRRSWLDFLPPFNGPSFLSQQCQYVSFSPPSPRGMRPVNSPPVRIKMETVENKDGCPCCFCNEDLLKLQSMLCSTFATEAFSELVHSLICNYEGLRGYDSLRLLCMYTENICPAIDVLVDKYPKVLSEFNVSALGTDIEQWRYSVGALMSTLREATTTKRRNVYIDAIRGVLLEMTTILSPIQFLDLLPGEGNMAFFTPYLEQCYQRQQANELCMQIRRKAETLRIGT